MCAVDGCDGRVVGRGLCTRHYQRWQKYGDVTRGRLPLAERVAKKYVIDASGCWLWTAAKDTSGYGRIVHERRVVPAHRITYELAKGPIPDGLELDHLCRVRACVNPDHLEPVTHKENLDRAPWSAAVMNRSKTHCAHGHEFAGDNLIIRKRGGRACRACVLEASRRSRKRKVAS